MNELEAKLKAIEITTVQDAVSHGMYYVELLYWNYKYLLKRADNEKQKCIQIY